MKERLKELLHKNPFEAFRIVTTSGKEYEISNPELVASGESEITVYLPKSDQWAQIRLNQIVALESAPPA